MAKVSYKTCDVCRKTLRHDTYRGVFDYKRIRFSLLNHMDICFDCLRKLATIDIENKDEEEMVKATLDRVPSEYCKKGNEDLYAAYFNGVDAAINQLFKNKVKNKIVERDGAHICYGGRLKYEENNQNCKSR